jgi:hypothetical protein
VTLGPGGRFVNAQQSFTILTGNNRRLRVHRNRTVEAGPVAVAVIGGVLAPASLRRTVLCGHVRGAYPGNAWTINRVFTPDPAVHHVRPGTGLYRDGSLNRDGDCR